MTTNLLLRVTGFSTTRIKKRLAYGNVIAVKVIRGIILDRGLLDVGFSSLRDVRVVGLITCERVVLGKGAKVLIDGSVKGICPSHLGR